MTTLAEQLDPHIALSYREYLKVFVDTVFSFIKRLQYSE